MKTSRTFIRTVAIILLFFLGGCQKTNNIETSANGSTPVLPTLEPYIFKTSEPGKATLHGTLIITDPTLVLAKSNPVYLVPLDENNPLLSSIPPFTPGDVPQAEVDQSTGEFMFTNIDDGFYVVVVMTAGDAQIPPRTLGENRNFGFIKVNSGDMDKTTEIGTLGIP
jgi:hypothetical protein